MKDLFYSVCPECGTIHESEHGTHPDGECRMCGAELEPCDDPDEAGDTPDSFTCEKQNGR